MRPICRVFFVFFIIAQVSFVLLYTFHQKYVVNEKHRILNELQTIPGFRMNFQIKRSSMQVHGFSNFEVQALPIVLPFDQDQNQWSIRFQAVMNIGDHVYTFVDGFVYHHDLKTFKTNCIQDSISSSMIPPIQKIIEAIQNAKVIDKIDTNQLSIENSCSKNHNFLQVFFQGENYILCRGKSNFSSQGFHIIGADIDIRVDYLDASIEIPPYHTSTLVDSKACGNPVPDTVLSKQVSSLNVLMGSSYNDWYETIHSFPWTEQRTMSLANAQCSCKGPKKPCVFFHGVDKILPSDELKDDFESHWGKIKQHAPCCSSIKFAYLDTIKNAWDQDFLQEKVCTYALGMSNASDFNTKTIEETIIVTHSMANLMLGAAVVTGKCQIGKTTDWISLSGPLRGTMGSDFQQDICTVKEKGLEEVLKALGSLFGQCPPCEANKSLPYEMGTYCTKERQKLYEQIQQVHQMHTTALLCGESFVGLFSSSQIGLIMGGTILPHRSKLNDGLVELESCRGKIELFRLDTTYKSRFYRAKLNHQDTTFRHGDGLFGEDNKPVKWFECLL
jgi:hypothetical protein